jgi:hypothetical protein
VLADEGAVAAAEVAQLPVGAAPLEDRVLAGDVAGAQHEVAAAGAADEAAVGQLDLAIWAAEDGHVQAPVM